MIYFTPLFSQASSKGMAPRAVSLHAFNDFLPGKVSIIIFHPPTTLCDPITIISLSLGIIAPVELVINIF
jgi:hypothetical protein